MSDSGSAGTDLVSALHREVELLQNRNNEYLLRHAELQAAKSAAEQRLEIEKAKLQEALRILTQKNLDLEEAVKSGLPSLSPQCSSIEMENQSLKNELLQLQAKIRILEDAKPEPVSLSHSSSKSVLELQDELKRANRRCEEMEEKLRIIEKENEDELERVTQAKATISVELIAARDRVTALESQLQHQQVVASSPSQIDALEKRVAELENERDQLVLQARLAGREDCQAKLNETEAQLAKARAVEETLISRVAKAEFQSKEIEGDLLAAQASLKTCEDQLAAAQQTAQKRSEEHTDLAKAHIELKRQLTAANEAYAELLGRQTALHSDVSIEIREDVVEALRQSEIPIPDSASPLQVLLQTFTTAARDRLAVISAKDQEVVDLSAKHSAAVQELRLVQDKLAAISSKAEEQQKLEAQLQTALNAQRELWSANHLLKEKLSTAELTISTNASLYQDQIAAAQAQTRDEWSEKLDAVENSFMTVKADLERKLALTIDNASRLRSQLSAQADTATSTLLKEKAELATRLEEAEAAAEKIRAELTEALEKKAAEAASLTKVRDSLLSSHAEENARLLSDKEDLQQSLEACQAQNTALRTTVEELTVRNGVYQKNIADNEKLVLELNERLQKLSSLEKDREQLEKQYENETSNLRSELAHVRAQLQKIEIQAAAGKDKETSELKKNMSTVKKQLMETQLALKAAETKIESSQQTITEQEERIQSLQQARNDLKAQIEAASAKEKELIMKVKQAKEDADKQMKQLQKDYQAQSEELEVVRAHLQLATETKSKKEKLAVTKATATESLISPAKPLPNSAAAAILSDTSPVLSKASARKDQTEETMSAPSLVPARPKPDVPGKSTPPSQDDSPAELKRGRARAKPSSQEKREDDIATPDEPPRRSSRGRKSSQDLSPIAANDTALASKEPSEKQKQAETSEDADNDGVKGREKEKEATATPVKEKGAKKGSKATPLKAPAAEKVSQKEKITPEKDKILKSLDATKGEKPVAPKDPNRTHTESSSSSINTAKAKPTALKSGNKKRADDSDNEEDVPHTRKLPPKENEKAPDDPETQMEKEKETPKKRGLSLGLKKVSTAPAPSSTSTGQHGEELAADADERPVKQQKSTPETKSTPPANEALVSRTTRRATADKAEYRIAFSGIKDAKQRERLSKALNAISNVSAQSELAEFDFTLTHIVATPGLRTMKTLAAALQHMWLMPIEWAEACAKQKKIVPESDFDGFKVEGSPFENKRFFLHSSITNAPNREMCTKESCDSLLRRIGRGVIVDEEAAADMIVVPSKKSIPENANTTDLNSPRWVDWNGILQMVPQPRMKSSSPPSTTTADDAEKRNENEEKAEASKEKDEPKRKRGVQFASGSNTEVTKKTKADTVVTSEPANGTTKKKK